MFMQALFSVLIQCLVYFFFPFFRITNMILLLHFEIIRVLLDIELFIYFIVIFVFKIFYEDHKFISLWLLRATLLK